MADTLNEQYTSIQELEILQKPLNISDPIVFHDPKIEKPHIVQVYNTDDRDINFKEPNKDGSEKNTEYPNYNNTNNYSTINTTGKVYPLVQINTRIIDPGEIKQLIIYYNDILPVINLIIYDNASLIQKTEIPTLNNSIKVIIVPEVANTYKSISLEFKITDVIMNDGENIYWGEYKIPELNKKYIKELVYQGCSNVKKNNNPEFDDGETTISCNKDKNILPNTWEMLHIIANECGLGFSSTLHCQEIEDRLPRQIYNKSYENLLKQHLVFSGLDEDSVFNYWVDLYGYLVMVNMSWLIDSLDIDIKQLATYVFSGINIHTDTLKNDISATLVPRILSNSKYMGAPNNLHFTNFKEIVNNDMLLTGTSVSMYNFELRDINNGKNAIRQYDIDVKPKSVDDLNIEEYGKYTQEHLVFECNDIPINKQALIRKKFFEKYKRKIMEIELDKPNLGLQRGTLIYVIYVSDEMVEKAIYTSQSSNVFKTTEDNIEKSLDNTPDDVTYQGYDKSTIVEDPNIEYPNFALCGMYYIDSMIFEYDTENSKIVQKLYLIKRGSDNNIFNQKTLVKSTYNILEQFYKNQSKEGVENEL